MYHRLLLAAAGEPVQLDRAVRVQVHLQTQRRAPVEHISEVRDVGVVDKDIPGDTMKAFTAPKQPA